MIEDKASIKTVVVQIWTRDHPDEKQPELRAAQDLVWLLEHGFKRCAEIDAVIPPWWKAGAAVHKATGIVVVGSWSPLP